MFKVSRPFLLCRYLEARSANREGRAASSQSTINLGYERTYDCCFQTQNTREDPGDC